MLIGVSAGHAVIADGTEADIETEAEIETETEIQEPAETVIVSETISQNGETSDTAGGLIEDGEQPSGEGEPGADLQAALNEDHLQPVFITILPVAADIIYGQTLEESQLTGGEAAVPGTFAWKDPTILPAVADSGVTEYEVIFTPDDTAMYDTVEFTTTLTVKKADAVVLVAPAPMTGDRNAGL